MSDFMVAVDYVLSKEGGFTSNSNDKGGSTNFGLSLRFLRSMENSHQYGFYGATWEEEDVESLTKSKAIAIYKGEFWDRAPFDKIGRQENVNYIFDMAVNMGISPAIKCAQRSCWAVMQRFKVIEDDGILGSDTINKINECGMFLISAMRSERAGYYRLITIEHPDQKEFINGWLNRAYGG